MTRLRNQNLNRVLARIQQRGLVQSSEVARGILVKSFLGHKDCGTIDFMRFMHVAETEWIIAKANELGFDLCGIAPVEGLADAANLKEWLARGYAGQMQYMHDPRRSDIKQVLPDVKSVIVCALNYNTRAPTSIEAAARATDQEPRGWISRYACGDDYHTVVGEKLEQLLAAMQTHFTGS